MILPGEFDNSTFDLARIHLDEFIKRVSAKYSDSIGGILLEVGPSEHSTVNNYFNNFKKETLDISPNVGADYVGDITKTNSEISDNKYDIVICLEVLEHTLNPFDAIKELRRILKDGGILLVSAPLNWRIHGPVPDCWRFTEFGWQVLLKDFQVIECDKLETPNRPLFPIKYNYLCLNNKASNVNTDDLVFERLK